MPPVTIIIVAWNQLQKTLACLEAVEALDYPDYRVILVDNGSDPPLESTLRERFPAVEYLRLPRNAGFAAGYNAGLRAALTGASELLCLLNNDTLPAADSLAHLVREAVSEQDIGLVSAKIYYADEPNRIWTVGHDLNVFLDLKRGGKDEYDRGQWSVARDIDFAPFCGIVLKRAVVENLGLLDEHFFLYYEDMDYCRRMRQAGYRLRLQPAAHIWHAVAASTGGKHTPLARYWMAQSGGRYFRKHGRGLRLALIVPFRVASAFKLTARLLAARDLAGLRAYWTGLITGWRTGRADAPPPAWITDDRPRGNL